MADRKSTLKMEERRDAPAKGRSFFLAAKVAVRARVAQGGLTARCPRKIILAPLRYFSTSSLAARYAVTAAPCSKKKGKPLAGRNLTKYKRHGKDRLQDDARHRTVASQPPSE